MTPYDLRNELLAIGAAWLNAPPESEPLPYMVAFLVTSELVTFDGGRSYDYRIDCVGDSFVAAQTLADSIRLHNWPWSVSFQSEKDEYQAPSDGGDVVHIVSVNLRILA